MRLVIFSDLHGNSLALDAFLKKIEKLSYDRLIFCGDIFGYYYNQKTIIRTLSAINGLIWLKGNHDAYFQRIYEGKEDAAFYIQQYGHSYENIRNRFDRKEAEEIVKKKSKCIFNAEGLKIGVFHGTPKDSLEGRLYPDKPVQNPEEYQKYDIVILGHTHCRMERLEGNTWIVNSGSLGQPRDGNGYGFAVMDTALRQVEFQTVEIDQPRLYAQINQYDPHLTKLKEVLERKRGKL